MPEYTIVCDSSCDLTPEQLKLRNVHCVQLSFRFAGDKERKCNDMSPDVFYEKMRNGQTAKTAGVNTEDFKTTFDPILKSGQDIIYLGFSSALSITLNSANIAAKELRAIYPKRQIVVIDSLCASAGLALLLDLLLAKRTEGVDFNRAVEYVEGIKQNVCHWFTVDDLDYLKKGGRISPGTAFFGNLLGIKPMLHVDSTGKLVYVAKARGRHGALDMLCEKYREFHQDKHEVYISHADCPADAHLLSKMLEEKYGVKTGLIANVSPVIGAHSGPGTLALFFVGKER